MGFFSSRIGEYIKKTTNPKLLKLPTNLDNQRMHNLGFSRVFQVCQNLRDSGQSELAELKF